MAKSTSSSNLFSGFNPPKIKKESPEIVETIKEEPIETPKPIISDKDIDALVQERVEKILESKANAAPSKIGRPKKYMSTSKVISVRLDSETYDFVRKKGRTEYEGITDYINSLILKEITK